MSRLPGAVLYVCSLNRVRSPMAAGLTRRLYGEAVRVASCGLDAGGEVDPMAAAIMQEIGVDLSGRQPRAFADVSPADFDLIVALSPEAWSAARLLGGGALEVEHWPVSDPVAEEGSREVRLDAYRQTRRELEARIAGRFGPPPEWE